MSPEAAPKWSSGRETRRRPKSPDDRHEVVSSAAETPPPGAGACKVCILDSTLRYYNQPSALLYLDTPH